MCLISDLHKCESDGVEGALADSSRLAGCRFCFEEVIAVACDRLTAALFFESYPACLTSFALQQHHLTCVVASRSWARLRWG